mmetsp:Transcript_3467/g.14007  ORF Transcript_3467/g.14007 Transcript_3467/m.14007 type:complete len:243 (+) Transcript_3467:1168-1896(+)
MTPSSLPDSMNMSAAKLMSASECAALTCARMRAAPMGTTGYEKPMTYTPFCSSSAAIFVASAASWSITGTMAVLPGLSSKPASSSLERKRAALDLSCTSGAGSAMSSSNALVAAATRGGAMVLEKRYGRAFWRSTSTTSWRPVVKPPLAPPIALPSVELMMSTCPSTSHASVAPMPLSPRTPVAWHSSIITSASCLRARRTISLSGATSPSMLKTLSVAMRRTRASRDSMSAASRAAMSLCS